MPRPIRLVFLFAALLSAPCAWTDAAERTDVDFPDVPGFTTLKCDMHLHTVFSDGDVWPTVRVEEAWRAGLDVLAITDHIEYLPHEDDLGRNFNRSHEIAKPVADALRLVLVKGVEITRDEPHGHFNALFLSDCSALDVPNQEDAVRIANEQGAFVFWNHPEWKRTGPDVWGDIQEQYLQAGWIHGIEVFNGEAYSANAHAWALEKNLTILANTDEHSPMDGANDGANSHQRAMTLVFATEKTERGIREALQARRTVAFSNNVLVGAEEWVRPLFEASVEILNPEISLSGKSPALVAIRNSCAVSFDLEGRGAVDGISYPRRLRLPAGKTILMRLQSVTGAAMAPATVRFPYTVKNIWVAPGQGLDSTFDLTVECLPE